MGASRSANGHKNRPDLSVVVPLFNEEENVTLLYEALDRVVRGIGLPYELIFVDDGSSDRTFERAAALAAADPHLRVIRFRRNCGQTPAMAAGIDHARGKVIVTMDGDLQNDPADIPLFLDKMAEGYDLVVGWRHRRRDKLITRKIPSKIANWLIGKVTGVPIKDNGCSLKAYRAEVIRATPLYSEMHRFIPAMMSLSGVRIAEIKVRHHARRFGQSKYGLSRVYKVLLDLLVIKTLVSFVHRPVLWFGLWGAPAILLGGGLMLAGLPPLADSVSYSLVGTGLMFWFLAATLLSTGVLGELIFRTGDLRMEEFAARAMLRSEKEET